jgi:hypothetical protein
MNVLPSVQATPLYLSEMAPYNLRGALNILFQLAVTIGIFAAQLINYGTQVRGGLELSESREGSSVGRKGCAVGDMH